MLNIISTIALSLSGHKMSVVSIQVIAPLVDRFLVKNSLYCRDIRIMVMECYVINYFAVYL